jgi:hypothetical protein
MVEKSGQEDGGGDVVMKEGERTLNGNRLFI